jgi:putative hemolysin
MIPLLVFVVAAGLLYFAVVETAFGMLMRLPRRLEAEREGSSDILGAYLEDPLTFFVPVRLMRGTLLILAVILLAQPMGTGWVPGLVLLASSLAIYVLAGQLLPAILVRRSPDQVLEFLLPSFTAIANIVYPLTAIIISWLGKTEPRERDGGGEAAPRTAAEEISQAPTPQAEETRLLRSVVDFGETLVREVMTPRPDIVAIRSDATIDDLRRLVQEQEYSRLPVYTENLDNIVGLIVVKDLIQANEPASGSRKVTEIMRPAAFVPETKRVADLLRESQQKRFHMAIVVDEYGGTAGLVTLEDLIEELVGEIVDEYDVEEPTFERLGDGSIVVTARMAVDDADELLDAELPQGTWDTVGGLLLDLVGRVPTEGEAVEIDGFRLVATAVKGRRIDRVRIERTAVAAGEDHEPG